MYVRDDAAARDGSLDETVELLVPSDGELQVARRDAFHLQIFGRVPRQLQNLICMSIYLDTCDRCYSDRLYIALMLSKLSLI